MMVGSDIATRDKKLFDIFTKIDEDKSGKINQKEFKSFMKVMYISLVTS